jgi:hypothetical protein
VPYLPVDLDGKRKAHGIERALGLPRHAVAGGLNDLWEVVWREKSAVVDELTLAEAFGPDARILPALVARGFLEPAEGGHRVKGAAKWLFGLEGKSRGGKAASAHLVPGARQKKQAEQNPVPAEEPKTILSASAQTPSGDGSRHSLGSYTQHPAPSTQRKEEVPPTSAVLPVDPQRAFGATAVPAVVVGAEPDRRAAPPEPPNVFRLQEQRAGAKPRKPSPQERFHEWAEQVRAATLYERGRPDEAKPESGWTISRVNTQFGFVKSSAPEVLQEAFALFMDDEKHSTADPPWPLIRFVQDFSKYESRARKVAL